MLCISPTRRFAGEREEGGEQVVNGGLLALDAAGGDGEPLLVRVVRARLRPRRIVAALPSAEPARRSSAMVRPGWTSSANSLTTR